MRDIAYKDDSHIQEGDQLKEQGKVKESLAAYQKSLDLASQANRLTATYLTQAIKKAASIAPINQPPYKKIIYYAGIGGLCNRFRALCSYLYLSQLLDIPLSMCWYPEEACDCYFEELCEDVCEMISPQSILPLFSGEDSTNVLYVGVWGWDDIYKIYFQDYIDYGTYWNSYVSFVQKIPIKQHILQRVETFVENYWHRDIVGLHLRRTDLLKHLKSRGLDAQQYSSDEKFLNAIDQSIIDGCEHFFLATDNEPTKALIYHRFPGKIISYCQDFDDSTKRHTSVEDALMDLYLLAKCKKIIGSYHSSFSQYAAALGNIPLIYP